MVCTRVEPAIFEKKEDSRRGPRGRGVFRKGGSGTPLELSKYTSQRTTFQDFRCYQGVTLYAYLKCFGSLRLPVITSSSNESTCSMFRHYRSMILQIALEISWLCIVHLLSTPVQNNYFFVKPPTYIPVHSNLSESVKVRMCAQRIFKTVLNFLHFFKI